MGRLTGQFLPSGCLFLFREQIGTVQGAPCFHFNSGEALGRRPERLVDLRNAQAVDRRGAHGMKSSRWTPAGSASCQELLFLFSGSRFLWCAAHCGHLGFSVQVLLQQRRRVRMVRMHRVIVVPQPEWAVRI